MGIIFENTVTPSADQWEAAIMGARNPMNSWEKSDTGYIKECSTCKYYDEEDEVCRADEWSGQPINTENCYEFKIGPNDLNLLKRLCSAGTDHRKFMRMLPVMVTITAPLYWWKEFSTYKVGTVANSCSTMHKIAEKEFTLEDFSTEHFITEDNDDPMDAYFVGNTRWGSNDVMNITLKVLNYYRNRYLKTKDKKYWWQMIQLLPSSYNQKRTVMMNYEVLANIYKSRKNHKLDEWAEHDFDGSLADYLKERGSDALNIHPYGFCDWIKTLPYLEIITQEGGLSSD